jgi:ribosomal protein L37AE/L43A
MTTTSQVNYAPKHSWKTGSYGHHHRTWLQKILHTIEHKTAQGNICTECLQHTEKDGDALMLFCQE